MHIVVLDIPPGCADDPAWRRLEQMGSVDRWPATTLPELLERAHGADVVVTTKLPLRREVLDYLPRIRTIIVPNGRTAELVEESIAHQLGMDVREADLGDTCARTVDGIMAAISAESLNDDDGKNAISPI